MPNAHHSSLKGSCSYCGWRKPADRSQWHLWPIGDKGDCYQLTCLHCGRSMGRIYDEVAAAAVAAGAQVTKRTW